MNTANEINNFTNSREIEIWKKKLLDLGKRNNLVNYRDTKSSTLEILLPSFFDAFERITTSSSVQIFDDFYDDKDDDIDDFEAEDNNKITKQQFLLKFANKVPHTQLLVFNAYKKSTQILNTLMKKASDSITERGVNILYCAFGFLKWKESEESDLEYKAPIIMVPITISNESVTEPYFISHFDEDASVNSTLQYLLEEQYGIRIPDFDAQPLDEYLQEIEDKVSSLGWEVVRECKIATFSFNKLNMYLDMENNAAKIIANPNVAALTMSELNNKDVFVSAEELNEISQSHDLFIKQNNVVDADFSQTEAIEYAMRGKSFVLQGPPGTGKSQTITNMIAELIYSGKKVLFVSEKMAALEVVYNNLKKAKLSDFCLQLHSYKANKKDFIDDLYDTLTKAKTEVSAQANSNLNDLKQTADNLNAYNTELYKVYAPIDMSLYQLIGRANHLMGTEEVAYIIGNISSLGQTELGKNINLLNRYKGYESSIGYNYVNHPLFGLNVNDSSYAFKLELFNSINKIIESMRELVKILDKIEVNYHVVIKNYSEAKAFIDLANHCVSNGFDRECFKDKRFLKELVNKCELLNEVCTRINNQTKLINKKYDSAIYNENFKDLYDDFTVYGSSLLKRLFNSRFKASKTKLNSLRVDKKKTKYNEAIDDLRTLLKIKEDTALFNENTKAITELNLAQYKGLETNWEKLISDIKKLETMLSYSVINAVDLFKDISFEYYAESDISLLSKDVNQCEKLESEFSKYTYDLELIPISGRLTIFQRYHDNLDKLDIWVEFNHLLSELKENQLDKFVKMVLKDNYPLKDIEKYYELAFYRQWADYILKNNQKLFDYNRLIHERDIEEFSNCDKKQIEISKAMINAKLSDSRPNPMIQMSGSPASVITHEHEKRRKLKPIRTLMQEIPSFIQQIKPCFLMSPLSVSTFLSDDIEFDVTIFDEASQVFPEDAIVAIYRSKQLIVVGDSKQMPPTKFFMASDNDDGEYEEGETDIDSFESILDLCSTTFPKKSLMCHYRSRTEDLINFSNKNFYGYNLVTYPSVYEKKKDLGVDFEYIPDGVMDSRSKINIKEAKRVVDLVFEHFRNHPKRSLGVVAFNIKQQDAILKLLDKRRAEDPSLEEFFKPDVDEPFFVKNLETVQGDERDTIIFSITYAKNDKGQFALRFGPLNLVGGERRLNVAITRAKFNVKVVSSIRAYDIDVSRVSNEGPKLLHDYLDYAEHGVESLERAISVSDEPEFDSPFEQDVYMFLKEKGFDVTTQVGCSKYRIDLGLKRPGTSDYVLAIECDGATYHSSSSARDRDRLRQSILERMNWKFYRIWSTDWYKNNSVEKKALLEECRRALLENDNSFSETSASKNSVDISDLVQTKPVEETGDIYDNYFSYTGQLFFSDISYTAEKYVEVEGPMSLEYLLKKLCKPFFGRDKVTQTVKKDFMDLFNSSTIKNINGFLYGPNQMEYAMRKGMGTVVGDISYISDYELRNGMYAAIQINVQCKKDDLFSFVRKKLGFSRAGDKMMSKFESAFKLLEPYIVVHDDGNIFINESKKLNIIKRNQV